MTNKPLTDRILELPDGESVSYVKDYTHDGFPRRDSLCSTDELRSLARSHRDIIAAAREMLDSPLHWQRHESRLRSAVEEGEKL